jgi:hypothetical protein
VVALFWSGKGFAPTKNRYTILSSGHQLAGQQEWKLSQSGWRRGQARKTSRDDVEIPRGKWGDFLKREEKERTGQMKQWPET